MTAILLNDLTFAYEGSDENVFERVTLSLDCRWRLGLIGRNGRGKTTLLRLLEGTLDSRGAVVTKAPCFYFPFLPKNVSQETLRVVEEISDAMLWQIQRELSLLNVEEEVLYRPFETLSLGERTKVLMAALFLKEDGFLLIDEPTNHLDRDGRKSVSDYLKGKQGFIAASHDRAFLDGCIDHVLSIERNGIRLRKGNVSQWQEEKSFEDQRERASYEKQAKEMKRLATAAGQRAQWSETVERRKKKKHSSPNGGAGTIDRGYLGHQAAKMMKRAKTIDARRERAVAEQKKLMKNIDTEEVLKIHPLSYHGECLAYAREFRLFFGENALCGPLNFELMRGDRLVLKGKNGAGKSTLLKQLAGQCSANCKGEFFMGSGLKISYIPQDTEGLRGTVHQMAELWDIDETLWMTNLRKLGVERKQFEFDLSAWSSGQKKKALLAKSLCEEAHLYLWDEPLNYLDMISRIQLEALMIHHGPTIVFIEHDAAFCDAVATKELVL